MSEKNTLLTLSLISGGLAFIFLYLVLMGNIDASDIPSNFNKI